MHLLTLALLLAPPFDDVFDPKIQGRIAKTVSESCRWTTQSPWTESWVSAIRRLPAGQSGKEQYLVFLKETYAYNIASLNQAYALDATSFTDLASIDFSKLDETRAAVRVDDQQFLGWIAHTLFQTVAVELRRCDPGRLATSEALAVDTPSPVVLEATKAFDRIAARPDVADRMRRLTKKPVIVLP